MMQKLIQTLLILMLCICISVGGNAYADHAGVDWSAYSLDELKEIESELHEAILELQRQYAEEYGDRLITLEQGEKQVYAGGTLTLTANIEKVLDSAPDQTKLIWTSSDDTVATVNASGVVTGKKPGSVIISCTAEDSDVVTAETEIVVSQPVTGVAVEAPNATVLIVEGEKENGIQIKANVQPEDAFCQDLVWTSSNEAVATVDEKGYVSAVAPGTVIITVASTDSFSPNMPKSAKCTITVKQAASRVELNSTELVLNLGATYTLQATVLPENTTDKAVMWSSSDDSVITVANGVVRATGTGKATVICTASDGSGAGAECQVSVIQMVTGIKIPDVSNPIVLYKDDEFQLKAEIAPDYATEQKVMWNSSNPSAATVSEDGKILAVGEGNTTVTCQTTDGSEKTAACEVLVAKPVSSILLDNRSLDLYLGERQRLTAKVVPDDAYNHNVVWKSENEQVLTVDQNGNITPIGPGTAEVVCMAEDGSEAFGTCTVNVLVGTSKVTLAEKTLNLLLGSDEELAYGQLAFSVEPENATYKEVTWSSSDDMVATVDKDGVIRAKDAGTATITAKTTDPKNADRVLATAKVIVGSAVTGLEINGIEGDQLAKGSYVRLIPEITPENATNKSVTWSSSDDSVLAVDSSGNVRAVGVGAATVTCTAADNSGTEACIEITVIQAVTGIKLTTKLGDTPGGTKTFEKGEPITVTAEVFPEDATNKDIIWTVDDDHIVSIEEHGNYVIVTGESAGKVKLSASSTDDSGKAAIIELAVEHQWVDATCTEPKTCAACGETVGEALGHKWKNADYDHPKTCTVCGETEGTAVEKPDYFWNEKDYDDYQTKVSFYTTNNASWVEVSCENLCAQDYLYLYNNNMIGGYDQSKAGRVLKRYFEIMEYASKYPQWARGGQSGNILYIEVDMINNETWRIYMDSSANKGGVIGVRCNLPEFVSYYANGKVDYRIK